jgi:hypothetical protein
LETARTHEALEQQKQKLLQEFGDARSEWVADHNRKLDECRTTAHDEGVERGKDIAMADYEAMLDESVNNRLCDNERDIPWPVGVMMAGEQHRILQALAEEMGSAFAQKFARTLGIIHFPENLDAPSAVTYRNCEPPPKPVERDSTGKQIELDNGDARLPGYTDYWKYYLRQLDDNG